MEWVISRASNNSDRAFLVHDSGSVQSGYVSDNSCSVRPVFFLNQSVTYASGDGTMSNPIMLGD